MSRRTQNRERLAAAAHAAAAADQWLGGALRLQRLTTLARGELPEEVISRLAMIPRLVTPLGNRIGALLNLMKEHPPIAPWLKSPERVRELAGYTGALIAGGTLSRFVSGRDVKVVVAAIGANAMRFGIGRGGTGLSLGQDAETTAKLMVSEGARAVREFLADAAPGLASDFVSVLHLDRAGHAGTGAAGKERRAKAIRTVMAEVQP